MSHRHHKSSRPIKRLNEIFLEMGMEPVPEGINLETAREMVEGEGMGQESRVTGERETCNGKFCYRSKGEVERARCKRRNRGAKDLRYYHCPDCHQWHLTSRKSLT